MMKCTELVKDANRSVVEIRNMETDKIVKYVVCSDFDNSKAYGSKWNTGEYYNVEEPLGLYQQDMLRAAIFDLYGIKEPKVSYDRLIELAKAFLSNMDVDDDDVAELLRDKYHITETEAEEFGIKDKLFARKYKVVEATFVRTQRVTVKTIMPEEGDEGYVDDYIENQEYLDDYIDDCDDWELDDYSVVESELSENEVENRHDFNDLWNSCDFPDGIY